MLVVGVLNGWSASSRGEETRTSALVERLTRGRNREILARKSMLLRSRARLYKRFIVDNQAQHNELLLVGKSLGARNLVFLLNRLEPPLVYRKKALVTIDPCWPLLENWRPNLNRCLLKLEHPMDCVTNVYALTSRGEQAGALLFGSNANNVPVTGASHFSITESPAVDLALREAIVYLSI